MKSNLGECVMRWLVCLLTISLSAADPQIMGLREGASTWQEVDRLIWPTFDQSAEASVVVLADGGWLPGQVIAMDQQDQLMIASQLLSEKRASVVLGDCLAWGKPELLSQLQNEDGERQLDAVWTKQGQLQGQVIGTKNGQLTFQHPDLGQLTLALDQIQACSLALPLRQQSNESLSWSWQINGSWPSLALKATGNPQEQPNWSTLIGNLPLTISAGTIWVEGPQRRWLADQSPLSVNEIGAFGRVWPWQQNANLMGGSLSLAGIQAKSGICVHSEASLSWSVPPGAQRFHALVGIEDSVAPEGNCELVFKLDGQVVWQQQIRGFDEPLAVDFPVAGSKIFELSVLLGERYDIGDHAALVNAFFSVQ